MMKRALLAGLAALLVACGEDDSTDPPPPPVETRLASVEVEGWTFDVPEGWVTEEPRSRSPMFPRLLQIRLPGEGESGPALLIAVKTIGDAEANVERWRGQFAPRDEARSKAPETVEVAGVPCTIVEIHGTYNAPPFSREEGEPAVQPGQAMLGAVLAADPTLAFRAIGPAPTIERHREAFRAFLLSGRRGG